MGKSRCVGLLVVLVSAVAQEASWQGAVGGGGDELASESQDISSLVPSGSLDDLVSRDVSHRKQFKEARIENAKLEDTAKVLQQRVQSSEETTERFAKIAKIARAAEEAARDSYDQRLNAVVMKYESEAEMMSQTVERSRKERAAANATAVLAERELYQERRHRQVDAKYARNMRFKLNQTAEELQATQRWLRKFQGVESHAEAQLSAKLERGEKAGAVFQAELGDAREAFENRSKEIARFQASSLAFSNRTRVLQRALRAEQLRSAKAQDSGKEMARQLGMLRAAVEENQTAIKRKFRMMRWESQDVHNAARKNASEASTALRAAEEAHEALRVHSDSLLNHARADAAASSARADEKAMELVNINAELSLLKASVRHEQADSQQRALELRDTKAKLAREDHVLNATQRELNSATALVHQQDSVRESMAKTAAKLKAQEEMGLTGAHAQIAKDKVELEEFRQKLTSRTQEVGANHHDLDVALALIRDEQDFHTKVMKAVARVKRDNTQKDRVRNLGIASLNSTLEAAYEAAGTKNHELDLARDAWREANATLEGTTRQIGLAGAELQEQAARASESLTLARQRLETDTVRLTAVQHEEHDKDVQLGEAHAEIGTYHEQLRESASKLAREASARAALTAQVLKLENQTVHERAQMDIEHVTAIAAGAAKDQVLNATRQELAQAQAQAKLLNAEAVAIRAEQQAQQAEASERQGQLRKEEVISAQERSARTHLEEELTLARAELKRLNATHAELAKELGVTLQSFEAGAAKEVHEVHRMRESLDVARKELKKDREEMGLRDRELSHTRAEVEDLQHTASTSGALHARLSDAEESLSKFRQELVARDEAINQANISLTEALASVSALHKARSKLDSASKELSALSSALDRKSRELNATRAQQAGATRSLKQLSTTQATVASKLAVSSKALNLTRAELAAEGSELSLMNKELAKTMASVEDLKGMDTKLDAFQKEFNAYQNAIRARTGKLSAAHGKVEATTNPRSTMRATLLAKIKDIEQVKAKLRADGIQLAFLKSTVDKKYLESRPARADTLNIRRLGLQR